MAVKSTKAPAKKSAKAVKTVKKTAAKKAPAKKAAVSAKTAKKPAAKAKKGTMDFVGEMLAKAKSYQKSIVLPEGTEERTVQAAAKIVAKKIAKKVILLGVPADVEKAAKALKVNLKGIDIINPAESAWLEDFGQTYFELRKGKINKKTNAPEVPDVASAKAYLLKDPLSFGAMMVRKGYADSMVSGALSSTASLLRAGLKIIGTEAGSKTASSCFVMDTHDPQWGHKGLMIFSDCAVVPEPDENQLSDIAVAAGKSCKALLGCDPAVAMLSFSTKGSAGGDVVARVQNAVKLAHEKAPDMLLDGEMQADAALIPSVTDKKAPGSPVRGKVNTIIFPNLGAGNIGYKLVQRLAHADAYGPVLQGFAKPISDLSRGCSVDDIVVTAAITLVQAGSAK
jgi:phosphate acetyltransferase